ncbi:GNS1/SUR4 membrane protein [Eremomyces bilateralis CBS 781.70]|uniref:Elongation of fatty acids protein n=1 Tax=Eremomyces bilateralis CBS 781.70 TaxID=1392243 RepID=A0A6G1G2N3_9PEZI|nr:GNS1/SUR4 membrane protein [Eremomyces bilateralis CBS 781.70]KAF1812180.1 GNS1/SUR4 membrane protein [Eremomyces bilateralis CBS 781.70]
MQQPSWLDVGVPTLERPFGLKLWPLFELAFETVVGYKPQDFRFVEGATLMSTVPATAGVLITYYIIIFGGRELMKSRAPFQLNGLFKIHNFYLTAISGILLALFTEQLIPELARNSLFHAICSHEGGWTDKLVILYYLNYLTKYLELIDTVFLFLKKKPLTFLHTYHHGATAALCFSQLLGHTPVSWPVITLNLMVHVVMYWYYFQSARGIRIWWKKYITIMQISQFVIDLGFVYFASYTYFTSTYWPWLPNAGNCAGEEFAAISGMAILSSYLLLFISFYLATYKSTGGKGRPRSRSVRALVEMKDEQVPTVGEARRRLSHGSSVSSTGANRNAVATGSAKSNGYATRSRKA